jgi:hypothetical protein
VPKFTLALTAACSFALFAAGEASADRYASPAGSGTTCSQIAPCSLTTAVNSSTGATTIVIGAGTYGSPASPVLNVRSPWNYMTIRGESPFARPTIYASNDASNSAAFDPGQYPEVSDLNIVSIASPTTYYGFRAIEGSVNRVSVSGTAVSAACGIYGDLSNSACTTTTPDAAAIETVRGGSGSGAPQVTAVDWVNVSAVAPNGYGFLAAANTGIDLDIAIANSIFRGSMKDIDLTSDNVNSADADLDIWSSNFANVATHGTGVTITPNTSANNQSAAPQFMNVAGGDLRPLETSPTVNAGDDTSVVGAQDAGGNARIYGPHVDIGAYEWYPLPPPSNPAPPAAKTLITKLKAKSKTFTAAKKGDAFRPASDQPKTKKGKKPIGTQVTFTLSQADTVKFTLQTVTEGRKSGKNCVKKTAKNKTKAKCSIYKAVKGTETVKGVAGSNKVWWTGRWRGKSVTAGSYSLLATPYNGGNGVEVRSTTVRVNK